MEKDVTDATFEADVIEKSKTIPVLVDFWASWCGPCQMMGPILKKIAEEYEGKIEVAKVSTEENQKTPEEYGVMSLPTIKLFKDGKVTDEFTGVKPEAEIKAWIDSKIA